MDAWIGRVKWRRPYTSSRVFRGLLLYSSYAFSQIQSACQVRTILYFSANLVESRWGPFYLVDTYLHSTYLVMSTTHDMSYFHLQASTYGPYLNILLY